jgi:hypothetical protein
MPEIVATLPVPSAGRTDELAAYRHTVATMLRGRRVPAAVEVHVSARLYAASGEPALDVVAPPVLAALAETLGYSPSHVRELHLFHTSDPVRPRVEVRVAWGEAALPWHCAWCEPMPSPPATSGVCDYHRAALLAGSPRTPAAVAHAVETQMRPAA